MTATRIERVNLPDPTDECISVFTPDGQLLGTLTFEKGTSRFELAPGQMPHRTWPLKKKYRAR